jgi:hypothetical protein
MDCPYHDTHDPEKGCFYCSTTDEEQVFYQKVSKQVENINIATKTYRYDGSPNVYNSRIRKEHIHSSRRAEVIPLTQKRIPNALDRVHQYICAQKTVPDAYLRYLSTCIQPEAFCNDGELSLLRKQVHTKRSPPVSSLPDELSDQEHTSESENIQ